MKTIETLKQIAALVTALPGTRHTISLGCFASDACALLASLPGAQPRSHVSGSFGEPIVIEAVTVMIDGVEFSAQDSRPATVDEAAQLVGPSVREAVYRTADVPRKGAA